MKKNYKVWLEENELEEGLYGGGPSVCVFKKDRTNFPSGYPALSPEMIWHAGYEQCLQDLREFQESNKTQNA